MSYECHVTTTVAYSVAAGELAQQMGWKTSQIERDPLLGDDTFFYLTTHSTTQNSIMVLMAELTDEMRRAEIPVLRAKVEHIVYDTKKGLFNAV